MLVNESHNHFALSAPKSNVTEPTSRLVPCTTRCANANSDPLLHMPYREYPLTDLCTTHVATHVVSHNDLVHTVHDASRESSRLM